MDSGLDESWFTDEFLGLCAATTSEPDSKVNPSDIWDEILLGQHSDGNGRLAGHLGLADAAFRDAVLSMGFDTEGQEAKDQGI